jgi:hypothetical protein
VIRFGPLRGYVYDLSIYGGAGDGGENEDGAKVDYVTRLLDPELDGKGYVVVTDNYYTSETLALALGRRGIGFVGTCNATASTFDGFKREEIGTVASGKNKGAVRLAPEVSPGGYRTAYKGMPAIPEHAPCTPPINAQNCVTELSHKLFYATWSDSSKTHPVSFLANFCEQRDAVCTRQPKRPTEENPECAKEERGCPWLATIYGAYYGGVDTVDMDVNQSRFDHKVRRRHSRLHACADCDCECSQYRPPPYCSSLPLPDCCTRWATRSRAFPSAAARTIVCGGHCMAGASRMAGGYAVCTRPRRRRRTAGTTTRAAVCTTHG